MVLEAKCLAASLIIQTFCRNYLYILYLLGNLILSLKSFPDVIVSSAMWFSSIFFIVILNILTFPFTLLFSQLLSLENSLISLLMWWTSFFVMPYFLFLWRGIVDFEFRLSYLDDDDSSHVVKSLSRIPLLNLAAM